MYLHFRPVRPVRRTQEKSIEVITTLQFSTVAQPNRAFKNSVEKIMLQRAYTVALEVWNTSSFLPKTVILKVTDIIRNYFSSGELEIVISKTNTLFSTVALF